ncbi:MAG: hypothetical protein LiPW15_800 [Parcubacteria group bacterium LiPW_15]|nr:MAG: hypothetical protein LiPW15_800 [Parcubacteria group bacterium LiPW_15]
MKLSRFVKQYIDQLLIVIAFLFAGLLIWFFVDTTGIIAENFSKAISPPPATNGALKFHLEEARKLDLRGLE